MNKPAIFISSTYLDLVPYREQLWRRLTELKVKILGMEQFGARSDAPLKTCLKEVAKCDVFVGIIAYRYGSIDSSTKKSYTQLEYERAVHCGQSLLIYFFDDNAPFPPKLYDFGSNGNKLRKFKAELRKKHTIDYFISPDDLADKIIIKLKEILPTLPRIFHRPKVLRCKISRFKVGEDFWQAFVSYLDDLPIEIFTGISDDEMFPIPKSISDGYTIMNQDESGNIRYDFQYIDKWGYRNTLGGLNHVFDPQTSRYVNMLNSLLQDYIPVHTIIKTIDAMVIDHFDDPLAWKEGVKSALKNI